MTFDRSGTTDQARKILELTLEATRELGRMTTRPGFRPFFRIWDHQPKHYRSWLIQVPDDDVVLQPAPIVLERTWFAAEDCERIERDLRRRPRLQPTLRVREAPLPKEEFAAMRELGKRIPFPLLELRDAHSSRPSPYGIEGMRKDNVRLRSERVRLEWGGVPDPELKAVVAWAAQVRALCESAFPDADISVVRAGPTGTCSLCRRAALQETTVCPDCKVVYHRECWDYVGRCAIYGCGGATS
jgi:hypothetical protein